MAHHHFAKAAEPIVGLCILPPPFSGRRRPSSSSPSPSLSEKQTKTSSKVLTSLEVTTQLGHFPSATPHHLQNALCLWAPLHSHGLQGGEERSQSLDEQHSCSLIVLCLGKQLPSFFPVWSEQHVSKDQSASMPWWWYKSSNCLQKPHLHGDPSASTGK